MKTIIAAFVIAIVMLSVGCDGGRDQTKPKHSKSIDMKVSSKKVWHADTPHVDVTLVLDGQTWNVQLPDCEELKVVKSDTGECLFTLQVGEPVTMTFPPSMGRIKVKPVTP